MKKPMKFKRYDEGGEVADKEAGLKASKGEDVGFFQRLRMGNIDDPSSEAYKRFGAGRGRSERTPVGESVSVSGSEPVARPSMKPRPIERALSDDMYSDYGNIKGGKGTGTGEAGSSYRVYYPPGTAPSKPMASKPNASKPSKAAPKLIDPSNIKSERLELEESQIAPKLIDPSNIRSGRRELEESQIAPVDVTKLSLAERQKLKNQRAKSTDVTKLSLAERMKMKSGGSVSSASRRADGIATKGKTRGKIC